LNFKCNIKLTEKSIIKNEKRVQNIHSKQYNKRYHNRKGQTASLRRKKWCSIRPLYLLV